MYITTKIQGRLGDLTARIYLTYYIAKKLNIDFKNVIFQRYSTAVGNGTNISKYKNTGLFGIKNYIDYNYDFFKNIFTAFINDQEYKNRLKNIIKCSYIDIINNKLNLQKEDFTNNSLTILLTNVKIGDAFNINNNIEDIKLFYKLFYNDFLYKKNLNLYPDINERIGIHIRRTDFLDTAINSVLSLNEIYNIIKLHQEKTKFIIFSDDIEWCKKNIKIQRDIIFHSPNKKSYNDIFLMAATKKIFCKRSFFSKCAIYMQKSLLIK